MRNFVPVPGTEFTKPIHEDTVDLIKYELLINPWFYLFELTIYSRNLVTFWIKLYNVAYTCLSRSQPQIFPEPMFCLHMFLYRILYCKLSFSHVFFFIFIWFSFSLFYPLKTNVFCFAWCFEKFIFCPTLPISCIYLKKIIKIYIYEQ